jgi:hypothetical protein
MNTYGKQGEEGQLLLTRNPTKDSCPEEHRDEGPLLELWECGSQAAAFLPAGSTRQLRQ